MLAGIDDYLYVWQLPVFGLFLVGWLVGGGWLFRLRLDAQAVDRRYTFGHGVLVSFLSGVSGAGAAAVLAIGIHFFTGKQGRSTLMLGGIPCLLLFIFFAYQMVLVMHKELDAGAAMSAAWMPLAATIIMAGATFLVVGLPAHAMRRAELKVMRDIEETQQRFIAVYRALRKRPDRPPATLDELVERGAIEAETIVDPAGSGGFFYHPSELDRTSGSDRIIMCTFENDAYDGRRVVLFIDGSCRCLGEAGFQSHLADEENRVFAEALRKAEGG